MKLKVIRVRQGRNAIFSTILLLLSLCISLLIGEVVLRLAGYHGAPQSYISNIYQVDDSILDWRYVPNSEVKLGKLILKYNQAGFRDVDHEVAKSPGIKRIVVVGDSVSEGNSVKSDSIFARVLQSRLGAGYEVINIAASGLNTPQEVHLFELQGLQYKPDLVILNFVLNDADFYSNLAGAKSYYAAKDTRIGILNLPINPELKRLLKSSALIYFVKERVGNLVVRLTGAGQSNHDYYTTLWSDEGNRTRVTSGFDRLAELQESSPFELIVIIWPALTDYRDYRYTHIHMWVEEQARKRGFATIDLLAAFSRIPYRQLQVAAEDSVHPNDLGHATAADTFLAWYRTQPASMRVVTSGAILQRSD